MAYSRFKFSYRFPAGVEIVGEKSDENIYDAPQKKFIAAEANDPGIGVRRAQLVFSRGPSGASLSEDVAVCHFDFLNMTSGDPDDTWIAADFNALEGALTTWHADLRTFLHTSLVFDQIRWYRIGPNISPPNPPVKILEMNVAGGSAAAMLPPQVAISITLKHPVRRCWGRTYLPGATTTALGSNGRIDATQTANVATRTNTLFAAADAAGFVPVVYSKTRAKAFAIEAIQVDDTFDVIRRRRWDKPSLREVRP